MDYSWKPYVPVAKRRQKAARLAAKLNSAGHALAPVPAKRGRIATSYWGLAWCQNLERYSDYSNRLPRGRTYLRNGSVIDLKISAGEVVAQVMGPDLYGIKITIAAVPSKHWREITRDCARSIDSLVELLEGRLSSAVMERIARPAAGLFPLPREIMFSCSCPDAASMCKHVAAALYGIGARLDEQPELLFRLRGVDASELIAKAGEAAPPVGKGVAADRILDASKLNDVFGIDLIQVAAPAPKGATPVPQNARRGPGRGSGQRAAKKTGATSRTSKGGRGARGGRAAR
jgi:uncharacterized Zn finger protein